jgi:hypothetical protein
VMILGHNHPQVIEAVREAVDAAPASAPPPKPKANWPKWSSRPCRRWKKSAWSARARKPR